MPLWQSLLFVSGIPAIVGGTAVLLSHHHKVLMNVLITLGAGAMGIVLGLLTVGLAALAWGGREKGGRRKKRALYTAWTLSILVGVNISYFPHIWEFPGWSATAFQWLGGFIVGLGFSFLVGFVLDTLNTVFSNGE